MSQRAAIRLGIDITRMAAATNLDPTRFTLMYRLETESKQQHDVLYAE
eukprot:SAG31_NODE_3959_length_3718_cov_1.526389_4_plen_48_part_00